MSPPAAVAPAETEVQAPGRPPRPSTRSRWVLALVIVIGIVWSFTGLDISVGRLVSAPADSWDIARRMIPPDLSTAYLGRVVPKVFESVYIAWIGTLIAAVLSLPLAFVAAENLTPRWVRLPVRALFNAIRAVPELIVAVILLAVTGLGPWAGALAIGIHSVGTLGKLSAEAIEDVDPGPLEAIAAAGGGRLHGMRWAVLPQALPVIVALWLFRFEINVRASAVLGVIGAGGIGAELVSQLNFRQFPQVGTVLLVTIVVVVTIDTVSGAVRRRIISGGGGDRSRGLELVEDLSGVALA